jgi:hypothetical protein
VTGAQLTQALDTRRKAIGDAWLASGVKPGSVAYAAWANAYGRACARYFRASVLLPQL